MFNKNGYGHFILWLGLLLALLGCAGPSSPLAVALITPEPTPTAVRTGRGAGDTLQILFQDAPTILNPHLASGQKDVQVARIFLEPLASYDVEGNLIPLLAAEIPTLENGGLAPDQKSVTWKLKQDIQWSDGEPFTAADVVFTYEFVIAVRAASQIVYTVVENVTALDDYTVRVDFKHENPAWFLPFVGIYGMILPKHKFEAYTGENAREAPANITEPVGTGPYRVVSPGIKPQEILLLGTQLIKTVKIVFEPNPYFREADKPYFSEIILRGGGTATEAARLSLQTGQVDYAWNITLPSSELARFEANGQGRVKANFGASVEHLELNWTHPNQTTAEGERSSLQFPHPFFSDPKVRQAFAYAIDREAIIALYGTAGQATDHILVAPAQYKSDRRFYEFDLEKAAALLDEAGWVDSNSDGIRDKEGQKLSVLFQGYTSAISEATQRIIQDDLKSIGVDVELKTVDTGTFFGSNVSNPNNIARFLADMQVGGWTSVSPDPGLFLRYWTCEQIPQKSNNWAGFNFRRWCNEEYDALHQQAETELDIEKRREIFMEMNDMLTQEVVTIPLVYKGRTAGVSRTLEGYSPTPWDAETWNIKDWRRSP